MFVRKPREREIVSWLLAAAWALSIFAVIPLARRFQAAVDQIAGKQVLTLLVVIYLAFLFAAGVWFVVNQRGKFALSSFTALGVLSAIFFYWTWHLRANPEEALHFVQYGTLSILVYRALTHRIQNWGIYVLALIICCVTGTVDEIIQWATPQRFFDYRDIWLNSGAALLVLLQIALGIRPPLMSLRLSLVSISLSLKLAALQLMLFAFCLINTPQTVNWYGQIIGPLSFLRDNPSVMSEYGYRYVDPRIGVFFSRLSPKELRELDSQQGKGAGKIIKDRYDSNQYEEFLRQFSSSANPLIYEARVRLFRRDTYWAKAQKLRSGGNDFRRSITIAYREHLILKQYYGTAYQHSGQSLSAKDEHFMRSLQVPEYNYTSPVGKHLITRATKTQYLAGLGLAIIFLLAAGSKASKGIKR